MCYLCVVTHSVLLLNMVCYLVCHLVLACCLGKALKIKWLPVPIPCGALKLKPLVLCCFNRRPSVEMYKKWLKCESMSTGSPVKSEDTGLVEFRMSGPLQYMVWYHVVGLIWISEFLLACQQMTVAGAVVTYYFTRWGRSKVVLINNDKLYGWSQRSFRLITIRFISILKKNCREQFTWTSIIKLIQCYNVVISTTERLVWYVTTVKVAFCNIFHPQAWPDTSFENRNPAPCLDWMQTGCNLR